MGTFLYADDIVLLAESDDENGIKLLADLAGRALGSVVNKLKICKDIGYSTYSQLYDVCVSPIFFMGI